MLGFKMGLVAAAGLISAGLFSAFAGQQPAKSGGTVVLIPITGTVDDGMDHLVTRSIAKAQSEGASAIVLDVNSPGGVLEAAFDIRDAVLNSSIPTYAFVDGRAYSSAALITLAARHIYMAPGASIGEAEPYPVSSKLVSAVKAEFKSTAERNHRDPLIAAAMVDKSIDLPAYKQPGQNLTLDTQAALKTKIADGEADSLGAMLAANHLSGPQETPQYTFAEQVARFATNPAVSGLLLTLGFLGLLIEMQTLHGIAGVIGVASLALFFGSHIYAGFSNGWVIVLAIAGVVGILYELHIVPGHGAPGGIETVNACGSYLRWLQQSAQRAFEAGLSPLEAARELDLGDFADLRDPERLAGNLHRALAECRGARPGEPIDLRAAFADMITLNGGQPLSCTA